MNRHILLIGSLLVAFSFWGCQSHRTDGAGTARADIRYRVFEISRDIAGKAIPKSKRMHIEDSVYSVADVPKTDIALLLNNISSKPGMLADHSRTISWWPRIADTWSYSRAELLNNISSKPGMLADGVLLGGGGCAGFLGVRSINGSHEIRIEYDVTHTINTLESIQSKVVYEGSLPEEGSLAILTPFERKDGTELVHILLFDVTNWEIKS